MYCPRRKGYFIYDQQNSNILLLEFSLFRDPESDQETLRPEVELYLEEFQGPVRYSKSLKLSEDGSQLLCLSKGKSVFSVKEQQAKNALVKQTDSNISTNFLDFWPLKLKKILTISESGELCIFDFLGKLQFRLEIHPSKQAQNSGIKSFKNYEGTLCAKGKYLFVSCSAGDSARVELQVYELSGSDSSPKVKWVTSLLENSSGKNTSLNSLCIWNLENLGFDITEFDLFKDVHDENIFGSTNKVLQKDRLVLYGVERGLDNIKSFVSYFFDGVRLVQFREPFTCKYNIYSIDKLIAFKGCLLCIDRMARLNVLSLKSPNERPHFAPLYPQMEITGTPEREK